MFFCICVFHGPANCLASGFSHETMDSAEFISSSCSNFSELAPPAEVLLLRPPNSSPGTAQKSLPLPQKRSWLWHSGKFSLVPASWASDTQKQEVLAERSETETSHLGGIRLPSVDWLRHAGFAPGPGAVWERSQVGLCHAHSLGWLKGLSVLITLKRPTGGCSSTALPTNKQERQILWGLRKRIKRICSKKSAFTLKMHVLFVSYSMLFLYLSVKIFAPSLGFTYSTPSI